MYIYLKYFLLVVLLVAAVVVIYRFNQAQQRTKRNRSTKMDQLTYSSGELAPESNPHYK
jgi:hypothetical protein